MNANDLLISQHREVEEVYEQYKEATGSTKSARGKKILILLTAHSQIEEEFYYPELDKLDKKAVADEYRAEHVSAKALIDELMKMDGEAEEFEPTMKALMEEIIHHAGEEEEVALPLMAELLGEDKLKELGPKMEKRFEEIVDSLH